MKKFAIAAIALFAFGTVTVNAQNDKPATAVAQENKVQVKSEELPQPVKTALAADEYKGWTMGNIYLVKAEKEHFAIEMKKGTEVTTLKLDKEGNKI